MEYTLFRCTATILAWEGLFRSLLDTSSISWALPVPAFDSCHFLSVLAGSRQCLISDMTRYDLYDIVIASLCDRTGLWNLRSRSEVCRFWLQADGRGLFREDSTWRHDNEDMHFFLAWLHKILNSRFCKISVFGRFVSSPGISKHARAQILVDFCRWFKVLKMLIVLVWAGPRTSEGQGLIYSYIPL